MTVVVYTRVAMVWIVLYVPVAVYLWWAYTSRMEPLSLSIMAAVIAGFFLVEWSLARRDPLRPRSTMAILCITLLTLIGGIMFR
ncbi:MAG TPA: hypothetical protein PLW83_09335 [Deltaproteobacteria bacterium]|nr:hypothetical protein [Deltaproteobacteria bacterium]